MDLKDRFFGRGTPQPSGPPVANPRMTDPPSFQLLFPGLLDLDADALTLALRGYHTDLAAATAELLHMPAPLPEPEGPGGPGGVMGLLGWGRHVVKLVGFDSPMPPSAVERCVQPAHFDMGLKEQAYRHQSHVLLFYAGYDDDALERHVALAASAGALARFGAIVAMNETGRSSVPAVALLPHEEDAGDTLAAMRALPLPFLYAGFVKIEVESEPGVWMRTYGCHAFDLPDLAIRAEGHHVGHATFNMFGHLLAYLREGEKRFVAGDTIQVSDGRFLRLRDRTEAEWFLESEGQMLVAESIHTSETNL